MVKMVYVIITALIVLALLVLGIAAFDKGLLYRGRQWDGNYADA